MWLNTIYKFLKKLNVFNYFTSKKPPQTNSEFDGRENESLLLSVPLYFYIDFIKTYYKSFILCLVAFIAILLAYLYAPKYTENNLPSLPYTELGLTNDEKADSMYIQTYSPLIYQEMLKELRKMQQAAANLQIKQQASDRKTLALQQQIHKLLMKTGGNAGVLNEEKAQNMIKDALQVYDADKLGLRDYALESLGGSILSTPGTVAKLSNTGYTLLGFFMFQSFSNPRTIIQSNIQPGKCFAFEGSYGKIRIKLSNEIFISAVTLEHVSSSLLTPSEIMAAPKHFAISGFFSEYAEVGFPLGQFVYSTDGPPRQTFLITYPAETKSYEVIEFEVLNNHGNTDHTCVYRLRIHGRLAN